ncbi:hypothetical protein M378DRAFT_52912, partial [Amanita muscaria Koide BX008]
VLVVVDALDECDEGDRDKVVMGLSELVRLLPSFKVILTTRPQSPVNPKGHGTFHLQDIEGEVVDVNCYRSVVGTIIFIQRPLPVSTLARLIDMGVEKIHTVLDNLQSVILLGEDQVPRIYNQSFSDYLTHLKYNILGLKNLARFMNNEDGLKEDGITPEQVQEKIPQQLQYACVYWANHIKVANIEDIALMNELEKFVDKHILHWFEVLSLIGLLDSAHRAIGVV